MKDKIFIFGASGHAKAEIAFLVDDDVCLKGTSVCGHQVIGDKTELLAASVNQGIVAIGSNQARRKVSSWIEDNGFELISAIHPKAQLARGVLVGSGSVIMAGAVLNPDVIVGNGVIVNTLAGVDHDCNVGDFTHIAPGVTLCGSVQIGEGAFICAGATIIPNLVIGNNVT
ncbi:serine acetyltransferase, partial [bacterium]|nr:serine acetyltransferase [bacterium]